MRTTIDSDDKILELAIESPGASSEKKGVEPPYHAHGQWWGRQENVLIIAQGNFCLGNTPSKADLSCLWLSRSPIRS
nr:hypothetical protein [Desulfobacterales bacterium]